MDNQPKYAACFYLNSDGILQSSEVVEGKITKEISDAEVEFTGRFKNQTQTLSFPRKNIFNSKEEAEKKIEAGLAWKERNVLKDAVNGCIDFLPSLIMAAIEFWRNITRYTINKYINVFTDHLGELLKKYPFEASMYFGVRKTPAKGVVGVQESAEYQTFDEPFPSNNQ